MLLRALSPPPMPTGGLNKLLGSLFLISQGQFHLLFQLLEATYGVKEAGKQLYGENGRQPDDEEVAEATGLSRKRLNTVLLTLKVPRSLEQKIVINQNLKPLKQLKN